MILESESSSFKSISSEIFARFRHCHDVFERCVTNHVAAGSHDVASACGGFDPFDGFSINILRCIEEECTGRIDVTIDDHLAVSILKSLLQIYCIVAGESIETGFHERTYTLAGSSADVADVILEVGSFLNFYEFGENQALEHLRADHGTC